MIEASNPVSADGVDKENEVLPRIVVLLIAETEQAAD